MSKIRYWVRRAPAGFTAHKRDSNPKMLNTPKDVSAGLPRWSDGTCSWTPRQDRSLVRNRRQAMRLRDSARSSTELWIVIARGGIIARSALERARSLAISSRYENQQQVGKEKTEVHGPLQDIGPPAGERQHRRGHAGMSPGPRTTWSGLRLQRRKLRPLRRRHLCGAGSMP